VNNGFAICVGVHFYIHQERILVDNTSSEQFLNNKLLILQFLKNPELPRLNDVHLALCFSLFVYIVSYIKRLLDHVENEVTFYMFWEVFKEVNLV
jgi:hypothetical protein